MLAFFKSLWLNNVLQQHNTSKDSDLSQAPGERLGTFHSQPPQEGWMLLGHLTRPPSSPQAAPALEAKVVIWACQLLKAKCHVVMGAELTDRSIPFKAEETPWR